MQESSSGRLRTSLRLNNDLSVAEFVELTVLAEKSGFDQVWVSNDLFLRSAAVMVTAAGIATQRIKLGIGLMNPYSMHPSEIAMMAATLQEVTGGRFLLGLGAGAEEFLQWAGIGRPRPLATTRQAIVQLTTLLAGGRPAGSTDAPGWTAEGYLRFPSAPTPLYVGAMSPKMLALAGELADGVLPLLYPPEHYSTANAQVEVGVEAAGRDRSTVDVAACIWVSVDQDGERARWALAEKIAYYGASFAPYLLERAGLSVADFEPIQEALRQGDLHSATALVTPQMLHLGVAGTVEEVVARCAGLIAAGITHLSFGPPLGPDLLRAVAQLGNEVLPALRGGLPD